MSSITTIYDALISGVESRLTDHYRLPYPYDLEKNNEEFLDQGYALRVLSMEKREDVEFCGRTYYQRTFEIVITRRYWATDQNAANKATTEKNILEDLQTLYAWLDKPDAISSSAKLNRLASDAGVQILTVGDDAPFYHVTTQFNVEYYESWEA